MANEAMTALENSQPWRSGSLRRFEVGVGGQQHVGALGGQVAGEVGRAEGDVVGGHLGHGQDQADDERVEAVGDHPAHGDRGVAAAEPQQFDQEVAPEPALVHRGPVARRTVADMTTRLKSMPPAVTRARPTSPPPASTTTTWATWVRISPRPPIWDWRSPRPAPKRTADGTEPMNLHGGHHPEDDQGAPGDAAADVPQVEERRHERRQRHGDEHRHRPGGGEEHEGVRMTSAVSSLSPMADSRATRWTTAVDTPVSSRPR